MRLTSVLAAGSIAAMLAVSVNTVSFAAGGPSLLLGKVNAEHKTTTITNKGKGAALSLNSKASSPSLAVSSSKLVKHLNADEVDGLDGNTLQGQTTTYSLRDLSSDSSGNFAVHLPALTGTYQVSYQVGLDAGRGTSSAPVESECYLYDDANKVYQAYGLATSTDYYPAPSATAVISTPGNFTLYCDIENNSSQFSTYDDASSYISFTKILKPVDGGTLTTAPPTPVVVTAAKAHRAHNR